ncbi:5804_t:CDS:2 [Cetraspora pellucida]|uniref:5804_t:CDS:1 n=1 Tax=Cetraspora pellucida TaxID=1433469 RepID=A0A9N8WPK7_9GLOM|nr:5804_t:CDS:2 [Cetraspora pellucida]
MSVNFEYTNLSFTPITTVPPARIPLSDGQEIVFEDWMLDLTVEDFVKAGLIPIDKAISLMKQWEAEDRMAASVDYHPQIIEILSNPHISARNHCVNCNTTKSPAWRRDDLGKLLFLRPMVGTDQPIRSNVALLNINDQKNNAFVRIVVLMNRLAGGKMVLCATNAVYMKHNMDIQDHHP